MSTKEMLAAAEKLEVDAKKIREAVDIVEHTVRFDPCPFEGTRAEQLAAFIEKNNGHATRQEIIAGSGIPAGTVASLLGSKKKFTKDQRGFWHVKTKSQEVPASKQQVEAAAS